MSIQIINTYKRLLAGINYTHHRYIYDSFGIDNRLTGLIGPRGTGKTTLLLQYIKEKVPDSDQCLYASIDNIFFSNTGLLEFVNDQYEENGVRIFIFDEIHKYPNWNQEIKNIYDSYPDIRIVFSGSSSIDLVKGSYDLSRRGVLYRLNGMSFREYLEFREIAVLPKISFDDLLENRSRIEELAGGVGKIRGYFKEYLGSGYYPFLFESPDSYHQRISNVIEKIVFEDISNFYELKTGNLHIFKRILSYIATIPPGDLSRNNISRNLGMDNKTIRNYLNILRETGLVELIGEDKGGAAILRGKEKIFLNNPDLYQALSSEIGFDWNIGTMRELFFIRMMKNSGQTVRYSSVGDFIVNDVVFEIGGRKKTVKQIADTDKRAYLVKDDIVYGSKTEIPLYLVGFLY